MLPSKGFRREILLYQMGSYNNKKIFSQLIRFVCAYHPVFLGSNPKHTIYAFIQSKFCTLLPLYWEKDKIKQKEAHIYKTPLPRYVRVSLFAKVWLSHRQMSSFYCNIKFLYKLEAFGDIKIENRFCTTYFISFDFSLFLDVSVF